MRYFPEFLGRNFGSGLSILKSKNLKNERRKTFVENLGFSIPAIHLYKTVYTCAPWLWWYEMIGSDGQLSFKLNYTKLISS